MEKKYFDFDEKKGEITGYCVEWWVKVDIPSEINWTSVTSIWDFNDVKVIRN